MKFLTRFFTHWTKKKIFICALVTLTLAGASFGATKLFGKSGVTDIVAPTETSSTMLSRPEGKTVADYLSDDGGANARFNLYVAQKVLADYGSFESVTTGSTSSMGVNQEIYSVRKVSGETVFKESRSFGIKKIGDQRFSYGGKYFYRAVDGGQYFNDGALSSEGKITWPATPKTITEEKYLDRYGCVANGLSAYILRDETIKKAEFLNYDESTGLYSFEYTLNVGSGSNAGATYYVLHEMKTNAGTKTYAEFESAVMTVFMDENWTVRKIESRARYKVPLLGGVNCDEKMTETFDKFGEYAAPGDIPEYGYFSKFFDAEITDEPQTETQSALDVIMDMFGAYMGDAPLNARIEADVKGVKLTADVTAEIDIKNVENITLTAVAGDKLAVSYAGGYLTVAYDELKLKISVDKLKSIFGALDLGAAGKESGFNFDAAAILDAMRLTEYDDGTCLVEVPLDLGEIKISVKLYGKKSGETYAFARAEAKVGDLAAINVELGDRRLFAPTDIGDYIDVAPAMETLLSKTVFAFKVDTGVAVDGKNLVAYVKADTKTKLLTVNVPDLFGETVALTVDAETARASYGKINLVLPLDELDDLAELLKTYFGERISGIISALPDIKNVDLKSVLAALATAEIKKTETGYRLNLRATDTLAIEADVTVSDGIKSLGLKAGGISLRAEDAGDYEFITPSEESAVGLRDLAEKILAAAAPFIGNRGGLDASLNGLKIKLGENEYAVNTRIRTDEKFNVAAEGVITLNGKAFIKADVTVVDGTIYGEVNGYRFAAKLPQKTESNETADKKAFDLSLLKGYNAGLDDIIAFVEKALSADLKTLPFGKLVKDFGFADGQLKVVADGSVFGLSDISLTVGLGENLSVNLSRVDVGENASVAIDEASIKTCDKAIVAPSGDFSTDVAIRIDENDVIYARLDFLGGTYKFDLTSAYGGATTHLYAEYAESSETLFIRCGDAYVSCPIDEIKSIIDKLVALSKPERRTVKSADTSDTTSEIKKLLGSLTVAAGGNVTVSAAVDGLLKLFDLSALITVTENFVTEVAVGLKLTENTSLDLTLTCGENPSGYQDFSNAAFVDMAEVFNDYFDTSLKVLADVTAGVKTWTFTLDEFDITVKGKRYNVEKTNIYLKYSKDETIADAPKIVVNGKEYSLKVAYKKKYKLVAGKEVLDADNTRIYVTFNDVTSNKDSSIGFSVKKSVIDEIIKNDLGELLDVIPQLKSLLLDGKIGLSNLMNLSTLVGRASYDKQANKSLNLTLNAEALLSGLGVIDLTVSEPQAGSIKLDVKSLSRDDEPKNVLLRGIALTVSADTAVNESIVYDVDETNDGHINLDSLRTLLKSFASTADITLGANETVRKTSYRVTGVIPIKIKFGIDYKCKLKVDLRVDVLRQKGKADEVYLAAKLTRTDFKNTGAFFDDKGGDGYIFYDNVSRTVTLRRNSINEYKWCKKCGSYDCKKWAAHWGLYYRTDTLTDVERYGQCGYAETVTEDAFKAGMVDYILELMNFSSTIENAVKDAVNKDGSSSSFGIDDVFKNYAYDETNMKYSVNLDLSPISGVMKYANLYIYHNDDEGKTLARIEGDAKILDVIGITCTTDDGIKLILESSEYGDATRIVNEFNLY